MKQNILFKALYASAFVTLGCANVNAQGIIRTVAGTGAPSFSGDGGPAVSATFNDPSGVATDATGNIYIADNSNHRIRKIDITSGLITTVAGSGMGYYFGMGGPALSAGMEFPNSIFVDGAGNYLFTDFFADCAYEVNGTGTISNFCGHNSQGCGGDGGLAPVATMELPRGVWKDHIGNTYLADYGNGRVRVVNSANVVQTLTGGSGSGYSPNGTSRTSCLWSTIEGVCADDLGNVYVSDGGNHVVRKIDIKGNVYTIAGNGTWGYSGDGGPACSAQLASPGCLFINSAGNLFICDNGNHTVRVINVNYTNSIIKTVAGTGSIGFSGDGGFANVAALNQPSGVWQDASSGTIYIADAGNQRIRSIVGSGYRTANGLMGNTAQNNVSIYPNPSRGTFTFITDNLQANTVLEVYNMTGQLVHTESLVLPQTTITLNEPAGMYNVITRSATGAATQRLVIE